MSTFAVDETKPAVSVVCGNDFPHSVFAKEESAEAFIVEMKKEDKKSKQRPVIRWRHYRMEVK